MNYRNTKINTLIIYLIIFLLSITTVFAQKITFSPETLYMGKIPISSKTVRSFKIYNTDVNNLDISSIQTDNAAINILNNPGSTTLGIAGDITIDVEFIPTTVGPFDAQITVESNTTNGKSVIPVSGEGLSNTTPFFERVFGPIDGGNLGSIQQTADGGYILVGSTPNLDDDEINDIYIVKTDEFGESEWTNIIEDEDRSEGAAAVVLSDDGHYMVLGNTREENSNHPDIIFFKMDILGNIVWSKTYEGSNDESASNLVKTSDGGYLLVGVVDNLVPVVSKDIYILKVDQNGNELWSKNYGGNGGDSAKEVINTSDGGFAIIGNTDSKGAGDQDIWLLKLDNNGNLQWDKTYGGSNRDGGTDVAQSPDDGYAIVGYSIELIDNARDMYLVRTDESGNEIWNNAFGESYQDGASNVLIVDDGIIIAGSIEVEILPGSREYSDMFIIKTDFDGNEIWREQFGGDGGSEGASEMILNTDNHIVITGGTGSYSNNGSVYFLNLTSRWGTLGISDYEDPNLPSEFIVFPSYPNPFNSSTTISYHLKNDSRVVINIYDILGHKIQTHLDSYQVAGPHSVKWDAKGLAAGTYFLEVQTLSNSLVKKMMYLK